MKRRSAFMLSGAAICSDSPPVFVRSVLSAIKDSKEGMRVVLTRPSLIVDHTAADEFAYVVPNLEILEPVHFELYAWVIATARDYMLSVLTPTNRCGGCTACCSIPYLKTQDWEKPSHQNCTKLGCKGCEIYWRRPLQCQEFECLWLKSQNTLAPMPHEFRPDISKVMLTGAEPGDQPDTIWIHPSHRVDPSDMRYVVSTQMKEWLDQREASGVCVRLAIGYIGEA